MRRNEGFEIDSTVRFLSDVASVRLKMAYSLAIKIESYISSLVWFKWVFSIYSNQGKKSVCPSRTSTLSVLRN